MEEMIKEINEIMGFGFDGSQLTIRFYSDKSICFGIYEQEVPLVIDRDTKHVYLDSETNTSNLTPDMITEIAEISKVIQKNIDVILKCVE